MRRFLCSLLSLGFVSVLFGCGHSAGVCDCQVGRDWCNYVSANGGLIMAPRPNGGPIVPVAANGVAPPAFVPNGEVLPFPPQQLPGPVQPPEPIRTMPKVQPPINP